MLSAFSAIIAVYGRTFWGGILYGIPEIGFSEALLWRPSAGAIVKRRTCTNGTTSNKFPSWSWVGWEGSVNTFAAQYHFCAKWSRDPSRATTPFVDFYKAMLLTAISSPLQRAYTGSTSSPPQFCVVVTAKLCGKETSSTCARPQYRSSRQIGVILDSYSFPHGTSVLVAHAR